MYNSEPNQTCEVGELGGKVQVSAVVIETLTDGSFRFF